MQTDKIVVTIMLFAAAAAAGFLAMTHWGHTPISAPAGAAAVTGVAAGAAVAIERIQEIFWTLVDRFASGPWPLNLVAQEIEGEKARLTTALDGLSPAAAGASAGATAFANSIAPHVLDARTAIAGALDRVNSTASLPRFAQQISEKADALLKSQDVQVLDKLVAANAKAVAGDLANFAASLKDDPGRVIMSLVIGAGLGWVVAAILGLDLLTSVLGIHGDKGFLHLGVFFTGLVIGLGANPTHEVIGILKQIKQSQKPATAS